MQVSAKAFEVRDIPNYMDLKAMRREMKANKKVWDLIQSFMSYIASWETQSWKEVDFQQIDDVSLWHFPSCDRGSEEASGNDCAK